VINRINDPVLADETHYHKGKWILGLDDAAIGSRPGTAEKQEEGRLDEIRTCIACNTCHDILCQGWFHETRCAVNPDAWREGVSHLEPSLRKKNVL